jgi:group II intron reverse transcriptase/maturase
MTNLTQNNQNNPQSPQILAKFTEDSIKLPNKTKQQLVTSMGNKLQSFTLRNKNIRHINHSIYHLLLDPFTLDNAYSNLSKNKGSLTEGSIPGTIQGYSRAESIKLVEKLKNKTYFPSPVRRIWVPKPGKKEKRPLGVPTFLDRIIQEAMRGILEAIYEPEFRDFELRYPQATNFGFRPQKSCWNAIEQFTQFGQKSTFVIEGDIKGAYNNVSFDILISIISRRVKDKNFINLLKKLLNAGIMDEGKYEHSIIGVPQGGILSPLLFNIYMFEFDKFIQNSIILKYSTPNPTKNRTPLYQRALYKKKITQVRFNKIKHSVNKNDFEFKTVKQELRTVSNTLLTIPAYDRSQEISVVYTRYADDWILGIGGSLKFTQSIKTEIENWLTNNLKLELSPEKTKISNIRKTFVPFLGYSIYLRSKFRFLKISRVLSKKPDGHPYYQLRRTTSSKFYVIPNKERLYKKIKLIGIASPRNLYPIGKRPWAALDEYQIVQKYHSMFLGLVGHYIKCDSLSILNRLSYIFQYSCAKTIATRKKITTPKVFQLYSKQLLVNKWIKDKPTPRTIEFMGLKKIREKYFRNNNVRSLTPLN